MADRTLAHRAQNVTVTEKLHLPPTAAPTNHGKTRRRLVHHLRGRHRVHHRRPRRPFAIVWLFWVGIGLVVAQPDRRQGCCRPAGHGQGGAKTRARQARTGGH